MRTHTRSEADSGRGGATVIDSFTPKFQDIGEPGLVVYIDSGEPEPPQPHPPIKCHCDIPGLKKMVSVLSEKYNRRLGTWTKRIRASILPRRDVLWVSLAVLSRW